MMLQFGFDARPFAFVVEGADVGAGINRLRL
jgi:hypothetical protein